MKRISLITFLIIVLTGCSKKTHLLSEHKVAMQSNHLIDSMGQKKSQITDRSTIIDTKDIDTNIVTNGVPLSGNINWLANNNAHFENSDIILNLSANSKTGIINVTAIPKAKKTKVNIHERIVTQNDIHSIEAENSKLKSKTDNKYDSTSKQITNHTDPSFTGSLKAIVVWLVIVILVLSTAYYLAKKLNIAVLIMGWIKKLF